MDKDIKRFIEDNIKSIEDNNWMYIYHSLRYLFVTHTSLIGEFTQTMLDSGINPLEYLSQIPRYYLTGAKSIKTFTIPNNIKSLSSYSFAGSYVSSLIVPENVDFIGDNAFFDSFLKKIDIQSKIYALKEYTFANCGVLKEVWLPYSLKVIERQAFSYCTSLEKIYYGGTEEEWRKIAKSGSWKVGSKINQIICSDGIVLV